MSNERKPCLHCGHTDTWPTGEHGRGLTVNKLTCQNCGASGPRARDGETAEDAWNRRVVTREQVEAAAEALGGHGLGCDSGVTLADHPRALYLRRAARCANVATVVFRAAGFEVQP